MRFYITITSIIINIKNLNVNLKHMYLKGSFTETLQDGNSYNCGKCMKEVPHAVRTENIISAPDCLLLCINR